MDRESSFPLVSLLLFHRYEIEGRRSIEPNSEQSEDGKPPVFRNKRIAGSPKSRENVLTGFSRRRMQRECGFLFLDREKKTGKVDLNNLVEM